jgi:predicted RNase H-like HicB family nuclease
MALTLSHIRKRRCALRSRQSSKPAELESRRGAAMNQSPDPMRYSLIIEWSDGDQVYIVTAPELPGCRTHGATRAEALLRGEEIVAEWLEIAAESGWEVPAPRQFDGRPHSPETAIGKVPVATTAD